MQERCRQEVVEVLGDEKAAVADMPKMPFVLATIAEVGLDNKEPSTFPGFFQIQRIARVAPSSIPHTSTASTTVTLPNSKTTYTFPKGSNFMANISFIMNDPKHFVDPDKFNPERFINENGK